MLRRNPLKTPEYSKVRLSKNKKKKEKRHGLFRTAGDSEAICLRDEINGCCVAKAPPPRLARIIRWKKTVQRGFFDSPVCAMPMSISEKVKLQVASMEMLLGLLMESSVSFRILEDHATTIWSSTIDKASPLH